MSLRGRQAPSRASATTKCQKCLQYGHFSYECKETLQARPYKPRPSRTQQLLNPKLVPKLSDAVPNDLLRKKGVADEELARIESERGLRDDDSPLRSSPPATRKRARSPSSDSTVSTVSTNMSRSVSPDYTKPQTQDPDRMLFSQQQSQPSQLPQFPRKRIHSTSSGSSDHSNRRKRNHERHSDDRNTRRRRSSMSPGQRGRASRPEDRERRRRRSRSGSMNRSQIAKHRQSLTPDPSSFGQDERTPQYGGRTFGEQSRDGYARQDDGLRHTDSGRTDSSRGNGRGPSNTMPPQRAQRERSMSPYSKRIALTQAMGN